MPLSPIDWHRRFTQQARWTRDLRAYLYPRVGFSKAERILDVGCGTGALLGEFQSQGDALVYGLDVQRAHLKLAQTNEAALLSQGDAHQLPYPDSLFDITLCHYLLLWISNPTQALHEMVRITRPGGAVLALAEPDYGGRIDHPPELEQLGKWQIESLQAQGADPFMGRKLAGLFNKVGLQKVETGVLGAQWQGAPSKEEWQSEWAVLEADAELIKGIETLRGLKARAEQAWQSGNRVLFVPTFYALGWVSTRSVIPG
ncbi:MAG: methyltransferase domain-containing protein [Anaerolineales bacterium]|nr:methyltransferase domain-containing protein [Anaerolineales bacterium]